VNLDRHTEDRLLDGNVAPDDAPPGLRPIAELIHQLRAPANHAELARESEMVGVMVATRRRQLDAARATRAPRRRRARIAIVAAAGVGATLVLFGGLAVANVLPRSAQGIAADVLDRVGVSVPDPTAPDTGTTPTDDSKGSHPAVPSSPVSSGSPTPNRGAASPPTTTTATTTPAQDSTAPGNSDAEDPSAHGNAIADEKSGGKSGGTKAP
jgi:hypothetical protein